MWHIQPPTQLCTDNETEVGIFNKKFKQKKLKAIDMNFYRLQVRVYEGEFIIYRKRGSNNLDDYFTKHHPPYHHQRIIPMYLQSTSSEYPTILTSESNSIQVSCEGVFIRISRNINCISRCWIGLGIGNHGKNGAQTYLYTNISTAIHHRCHQGTSVWIPNLLAIHSHQIFISIFTTI